jgi:hypothetical protein
MSDVRGSERLMAALNSRLTEESIGDIARILDSSPGVVEDIEVHGDAEPTGVSLTVSYSGDDGVWCGNDIRFWWEWMRKHGGVPKPPRIIINGTPWPDFLKLKVTYGRDPIADIPTIADLPNLKQGGFGR